MEADIVVVGGGGAGLMAAFSAARLGRKVVVLEKNERFGGTTALSVGSITSSCTSHQTAAGIDDSPAEHFEDMGKFAGERAPRDNLALRRLLTESMPETMRLLMSLGIEFVGPLEEPPHRVPRMHVVVPHSRSFIHHLLRHCRREGVLLITAARVDELLVNHGRVVGLEFAQGSTRGQVWARRGVILASGDMSSNAEYKAKFMPRAVATIDGINPSSTGDGQQLGEKLGAEVVNGDLAWGPELRFPAPPQAGLAALLPPARPVARLVKLAMDRLPQALLRPFLLSFVTTYLAPSPDLFREGAILVNKAGARFCDELEGPQYSVPRQPEKSAFIVMDRRTAEKFDAWPHYISTAPGVAYAYLSDYRRSRRDIFFEAPDLPSLAGRIGVPAVALEETVRSRNAALSGQARPPLGEGPFYALGPLRSWIAFSEGGLRVTERLEVLHASGRVIPGLFAAGSAGQGGLLLAGHGHHLGWAFTSGRIAGRHAAYHQPSETT